MSSTKHYYATTEIVQGDIVFENTWDFTGNKTDENAIKHLTAIFEEVDFGSLDPHVDFDDEAEINFYGMTPKEFATFIVKHGKKAKKLYDTEWFIHVHEEIDYENYEHPCSVYT